MKSDHPIWRFVDSSKGEFDRTEEDEYCASSVEELDRVIRLLAEMSPRIVVVRISDVEELLLAVGGDLAGVEYFNSDTLRSVGAISDQPVTDDPRNFIAEGQPSVFQASRLHPVQHVISIVKRVYETGELPASVMWG